LRNGCSAGSATWVDLGSIKKVFGAELGFVVILLFPRRRADFESHAIVVVMCSLSNWLKDLHLELLAATEVSSVAFELRAEVLVGLSMGLSVVVVVVVA